VAPLDGPLAHEAQPFDRERGDPGREAQ
jgi:hypothetical protein